MSQTSHAGFPTAAHNLEFTKPTARQWLLHVALFLLTFFTTTICGLWMIGDLSGAGLNQPIPAIGGSLLALPVAYLTTVARIVRFALLHPSVLADGLKFSGALRPS